MILDREFAQSIKMSQRGIIDVVQQIHESVPPGSQLTGASYNALKPMIRDFQEKLLAHWKAQGGGILEHLQEQVKGDREKEKIIEFLSVNLKDLKVQTVMFCDQHPADMGDIYPKGFMRDFEGFSRHVVDRIKDEEQYFIPLLQDFSA